MLCLLYFRYTSWITILNSSTGEETPHIDPEDVKKLKIFVFVVLRAPSVQFPGERKC